MILNNQFAQLFSHNTKYAVFIFFLSSTLCAHPYTKTMFSTSTQRPAQDSTQILASANEQVQVPN